MQVTGAEAGSALARAVSMFEEIEARPAAALARKLAVSMGIADRPAKAAARTICGCPASPTRPYKESAKSAQSDCPRYGQSRNRKAAVTFTADDRAPRFSRARQAQCR